MQVVKRDSTIQPFTTNKITHRLLALQRGEITDEKRNFSSRLPDLTVKVDDLVDRIKNGICNLITTFQIDDLSADICASMLTIHPDYGTMASRILVSNLHKQTLLTFKEKAKILYENKLIAEDVYEIIYKNDFDSFIKYENDYNFNFFGMKTLMRSYLLKVDNQIIERPQDLLMRVAIGIHKNDFECVIRTYNLMSQKYFIHATPTLFNAGTRMPQMSSCFLLDMDDDSIKGIYSTITKCAMISKNAGGIGVHIHKIRGKGSKIRGTGGTSNGIVPMLKVFDSTAKYVDQGGNKRPGSIAVYLEPWHPDIFEFLDLRKNTGKDEIRARDLFLGLWVPDLFMERVEKDLEWSLFCPDETMTNGKRLCDIYGDEFKTEYERLEKEGKAKRIVKAQFLWKAIVEAQIETGNPYMLYKDACNIKNNQKNLGTLKGSNLCTEIMEFTSPDEIAVCNLGSIALPMFITKIEDNNDKYEENNFYEEKENKGNIAEKIKSKKNFNKKTNKNESSESIENNFNLSSVYDFDYEEENKKRFKAQPIINQKTESESIKEIFSQVQEEDEKTIYITDEGSFYIDYEKIREIAGVLTNNLNKIIDNNYYPVEEAKNSNFKHRPIGIGVQGLADVFAILKLPFESEEARKINRLFFENIYYGALQESNRLAMIDGTYESYKGSPISEGKLQFDLWGFKETSLDWTDLRENIKKYGVRNSLLLAPMPTASTSQILGYNECIEPFTSNIYSRRTLAGEFQMINEHLFRDLVKHNLWSLEMKNILLEHEGSIQNISIIPQKLKEIYKTAWEIKMKCVIDLAADRACFIDQSQSLNLFVAEPTYSKVTSMHFYGWKKGLKTGMYYLRTRPITAAIKFTVDKEMVKEMEEGFVCKMEDGCMSCSG
ncbi:hypothetical protein GVAV_000561 [Gurleya vavrai]